ncbi:hypothetical protein BGX38DRAFT_1195937 [Terfezia claveryi]|nr:hypothetical protein BGX38DRAFT_1240962 [Terfezia claveryi]KAF8445271.1 hypothetical protein BGX38DRAFT_1195937 [Terfezia claveryi]
MGLWYGVRGGAVVDCEAAKCQLRRKKQWEVTREYARFATAKCDNKNGGSSERNWKGPRDLANERDLRSLLGWIAPTACKTVGYLLGNGRGKPTAEWGSCSKAVKVKRNRVHQCPEAFSRWLQLIGLLALGRSFSASLLRMYEPTIVSKCQ